jgi:large subunit ribosomal protein L5e
VGSDDLEDIYTNAHAAIRADPTFKPTDKSKDWKTESKKHKAVKLTYAQRHANIEARIQAFKSSAGNDAEASEDDDE